MTLLQCDGSFEGFLSAVFLANTMRPLPDGIWLRPAAQMDFLTEVTTVETNMAHAERVLAAIRKRLSWTTEQNVRNTLAYGFEDCGNLLFRYLQKGWQIGNRLDDHLTDDDVLKVHKYANRVGFEVHRLTGLIRFTLTQGNVYYAPITPDHDVLEMLAGHFMDRFYDQPSAIHDRARGKLLMFYRGACEIRIAKDLPTPEQHPYDQLVVDLWRTFFHAITVESRANAKLQRNFMPKRYWKNMPEMQGKA